MSKLELIQKINLCLDDFYGPREVLTLLLIASPAPSTLFPLLQFYPRDKHPIMGVD